jgi:hypothetical protein
LRVALDKEFEYEDNELSGETWKKELSNVWIVLKNYFLNFRKITMGTLYIKKYIYIWNKFLYFQSCNYIIFMKIHHVSRILLYV